MGIALSLLPLLVTLIVARLFLVTLKHGNTPLITAIALIEQNGVLPSGLAAYTRVLTGVWGGFLIFLGVSHLLFSPYLTLHLHPAMQFFIDPVAILLFFSLEFIWRIRRFPDCSFAPPWKLWRLISRNGGLLTLYRQCQH